jgi:hypothetical protein
MKRYSKQSACQRKSCLVEAVIEYFKSEFLLVQLDSLELLDVDPNFTSFHGWRYLVKQAVILTFIGRISYAYVKLDGWVSVR